MGIISKTLIAGGVVAAILYLPQFKKVNNYMKGLLEDLNFGKSNKITPMPNEVKNYFEQKSQGGYRIKPSCLKEKPLEFISIGLNPVTTQMKIWKTMDEIPAGVPRDCIISAN